MVDYTIEVRDSSGNVLATVTDSVAEGGSKDYTVSVEDPSPQASISGN